MQRNQVEEFYRELDATREDFVRDKFAMGGYVGWKIKHVKQWLARKDENAKARHASSVRLWTMVAGIATAVAAAVAVVSMFYRA